MKLPHLAIGCCGVFVIACVAGYAGLQYSNYYVALDKTREWARMADFPASATNIDVEITGSMFTREFVVLFDAPAADINNWLAQSAGTAGVTPESSNGVRKYAIEPGGGAQFAEIQVDDNENRVRIRTYWS